MPGWRNYEKWVGNRDFRFDRLINDEDYYRNAKLIVLYVRTLPWIKGEESMPNALQQRAQHDYKVYMGEAVI